MLMGINAPIRIGRATVMPGDIVLAKHEGVIFIPAQFAAEVVETSEVVRIRDMFGHQRLREGKYTPGQIDSEWTADIEDDFINWVKKNNIKIDIEKCMKHLHERYQAEYVPKISALRRDIHNARELANESSQDCHHDG